ncbi:MAG TPA: hypothetical protein VN362_04600 [Xanthobacteraceae bacterium]|jgi:hypothetical protein|nr:hypothetical protein [Xanthobacteraceae bacterium]
MRKMILSAAFVIAATAALAQAPADMVRVRGTVQSVDGSMLTVKSRDGADLKIKLADNAVIRTVTGKTVADVKQGLFVGITAMPQPDGTQKAVEIHIFPEAARGTGEGHRPWDLMPGSTMTNANVDSEVAISDGKKLVLKYKDGDKTFIVPDNVKVVMFAPGTATDVKPGAKIFIVAAKKMPDGTLEAPGATVSSGGVDPPM